MYKARLVLVLVLLSLVEKTGAKFVSQSLGVAIAMAYIFSTVIWKLRFRRDHSQMNILPCFVDSVKYCCSHCLEEFPEKGEALAHTAAMECLAKEFQCSTCRLEFTDASLLQNHLCGGKPR